jgi:hypothetical protein
VGVQNATGLHAVWSPNWQLNQNSNGLTGSNVWFYGVPVTSQPGAQPLVSTTEGLTLNLVLDGSTIFGSLPATHAWYKVTLPLVSQAIDRKAEVMVVGHNMLEEAC